MHKEGYTMNDAQGCTRMQRPEWGQGKLEENGHKDASVA